MSIFGIFGRKIPSSVTAHILDPNTGYSKQTWTVGQHVPRETVEKLSEDGNIFVVVAYEAGTPKQMICRRDIWNQTKAQFESIEATGQASMRRIMDEIEKLR
jgi:hypothetical protein